MKRGRWGAGRTRGGVVALALAVLLAVVIGGALPALAGSAKTKLVSKTSAGEPGMGDSNDPAISASGRFVAFDSEADNLPGGDFGTDVYVHDRRNGKTRIVSKTSAGELASGYSARPAISASGRYVAFDSSGSNLPGEDVFNVYVHDRKTRKTKLVSKTSAGVPANGHSFTPSISASGRFVAFSSEATNLPGSINPDQQVYVHDRKTGKTKLVSKTSGGVPASGGQSVGPLISSTGRYVGFESNSTNMGGDNSETDVFVHDRITGTTKLISKTSAGAPATGDDSYGGWVSASGRFVGFESGATNLPGDVSVFDVYVRDLKTRKTRLISKTSAGVAANGQSFGPSLSASGRLVAFVSAATNLPGDATYRDVYIHDRKTGKTKLLSKTSGGQPATGGHSDRPVITPFGHYVAFPSEATNLPGNDSYEDVYIRGPLR